MADAPPQAWGYVSSTFSSAVRTRFFQHIVYRIQAVLGLRLKDRHRGFLEGVDRDENWRIADGE